jgi:hypothetical protein
METFIIQRADGRFWSYGTVWSDEYPDAATFDSKRSACAKAKLLSQWTLGSVNVVKDYGMLDQEVVGSF